MGSTQHVVEATHPVTDVQPTNMQHPHDSMMSTWNKTFWKCFQQFAAVIIMTEGGATWYQQVAGECICIMCTMCFNQLRLTGIDWNELNKTLDILVRYNESNAVLIIFMINATQCDYT